MDANKLIRLRPTIIHRCTQALKGMDNDGLVDVAKLLLGEHDSDVQELKEELERLDRAFR